MSLYLSAWWLQLRLLSRSPFFLSMAILTPIAYGSIAMLMDGSGSPHASTRIVLGAGLLGAWSTTLYGAAEALFMQRFSGTLEVMVGAPKSLVAPVLGFSSATATLGVYSVAAVWLWSTVVFHTPFVVANPLGLLVSVVASFVGLIGIGTLLAGLYVVTRQGIEITNLLEYPIWIVCGVLAPASILWPPLAVLGKLLPIGWAMDAITQSTVGGNPLGSVLVSLAESVCYFVIGLVFLHRVDLLVRIKGTLRLQ